MNTNKTFDTTTGNPYRSKPGPVVVSRYGWKRDEWRALRWEEGKRDFLAGKSCQSNNGAYLEGWHDTAEEEHKRAAQ